MTRFLAAFTLLALPFPIQSAVAQPLAERTGNLDNLFDSGKAAKMEMFAMDQDIPKMPDTVAVETPAQPAVEPRPDARQALVDFQRQYGSRLLQVPGVLGVTVGVDCAVKFPHVHFRGHMPALVIKLNGKVPAAQVRADALVRVPELSRVKFRMELGDTRTAEPEELRNWLLEPPIKALSPIRS